MYIRLLSRGSMLLPPLWAGACLHAATPVHLLHQLCMILGNSMCSGEKGFWSLFHWPWLYLICVVSGLYFICAVFIWLRWFANCTLLSIVALLRALFNYMNWLSWIFRSSLRWVEMGITYLEGSTLPCVVCLPQVVDLLSLSCTECSSHI